MKKSIDKAIALLVATLDGAVAVETSRGTRAEWKQLEKAGYVTVMKYGGALGHPFSYDVTPEGQEAIKIAKANGVQRDTYYFKTGRK